jgi:hypothetical protein
MILCPSSDPTPHAPQEPVRHNVHNPHARESHSYSLADDLAQSPVAMFVLEVLKTYPPQRNSLISTLGEVELSYAHLINVDLDNSKPRLPSLVDLHIVGFIRHSHSNYFSQVC